MSSSLLEPRRRYWRVAALALVWTLALGAWTGHALDRSATVVADETPASGRQPPSATAERGAAIDALQQAAEPPASDSPRRKNESFWSTWSWLVALIVGISIVLSLIVGFKLNAFLALITAATVVSLMADGPWPERVSRVAEAFGNRAGSIGLVIAMAAVIGKCMLDSGAADRIVRSLLKVFGDRLAPLALMVSGFVLAVPVFFDTVFYLLVPLARSLYRRTGKNYLLFLLAITAGGAITHTLVPPTPGPMAMADQLKFSLGTMILVGAMIAAPAALAGIGVAFACNRWMPLPMRPLPGEEEPEILEDDDLPPLVLALLPVLLPVLLISLDTVLGVVLDPEANGTPIILGITGVLGNPNFALMISTAIALFTLVVQRQIDRVEMSKSVEIALMSGGVIILITASGGAFGDMLKAAGVGERIGEYFQGGSRGVEGFMLLLLGFALAALLKVAQGSSTVAMITGSAMMADIAGNSQLPYHPVYLAAAIGGGSLIGSWMNDSGFWVFAKMGGLTETEALKSWTVQLLVMGAVSFLLAVVLSQWMPLLPN